MSTSVRSRACIGSWRSTRWSKSAVARPVILPEVPELVATGPGQVYTWDITKLAGPVKGVYYDAYVIIGISLSRYIVGVHVHAREHGLLAEEMMREVFAYHSIRTLSTPIRAPR